MTFLTKHRVDTVIITGCTTSGCVRASIIDAFSYGYRVAVPEDCCGDAERGPHEANLHDCARRYCEISDLQAMQAYLRSRA
jgi:maleamate amidohydrolase